ncbi:cyclic nucleotide-binding domain-containing protein [bacterium]|nr:cyclic nucleotide-binding domain-containing protein [bacterium]
MKLQINRELIELLSENPMFRELNKDELTEIAARMDIENYDSGQEVFREGDPGGKFYILAQGSIEIQKSRSHGAGRIVIARFDRGGVIGEMSLFDGMPRSATVITVQPTKTYVLSQDGLNELIENNPQLAIKFLKGVAMLLSLRLRNTSGWFADVF